VADPVEVRLAVGADGARGRVAARQVGPAPPADDRGGPPRAPARAGGVPVTGDRWPGPRRPFDAAAYESRVRGGPCFVCGIVRGSPEQPEEILHRDRLAVTFLARPGVVPGHTLVAPVRHAEAVVRDFAVDEYVELQRRVHEVGTAVTAVVPTERLYVLSLGSQQGNAHVHWHVVPLPPGVPYSDQQLGLFDLARLGVPDVPPAERGALAAALRSLLFR
jgi:diadenosine tetraphosphate (Ap4A) HIT family hydrolase